MTPGRRSLAWLATAAALLGQAPAPSLHQAWLLEVLDLEVAAAAGAYARIAADAQAPTLDRLVATARRVELQQHAIEPPVPALDLQLVPEVLRRHFQQLQQREPLFDAEVAAGQGDAEAVRSFFAATDAPQLRPLVVATVLAVTEQQNPSAAERQRQQRSRFLPWSNDPARVLDRIRANEVVRAELDGQAALAAELRRRDFPSWHPPAGPEDPVAAWSLVSKNLEEWLRERQLTTAELELLRRLHQELSQAAAQEPASALRWLERMPIYSERLLRPRPNGR